MTYIRPYIYFICLIVTSSNLWADSVNVKNLEDKYYDLFSNTENEGKGFLIVSFNRDVPANLQEEVLSNILQQACAAKPIKNYRAIYSVLNYLSVYGKEFKLSAQMNSNLNLLAKDDIYTIRYDVIDVLGRLKSNQNNNVILDALTDKNEKVRGAAIEALQTRSGSAAVYQKFIKDHQDDPAYAASVQQVKNNIEVTREKNHSQ